MYTAYPHRISCCIEKASRLSDIAGARILLTETKVIVSPFIAPRDCLLGDAAVMYMKPAPIFKFS